MLKKGLSHILITMVIMLLPTVVVVQTYGVQDHGTEGVCLESSSSRQASQQDHSSPQQKDQHCCHHSCSSLAVLSSPAVSPRSSAVRRQHQLEYHFVVAVHSISPDYRPPIV